MRDHRSLEAWQEARVVTTAAFLAARSHWKPYASALFDQLQRAALSVQSNIAEGYALGSRRFVYHLTVAYGSAVVTTDLLETGLQEGLLPGDVAVEAIRRSKRCQALLMGLIKRYRKP
jgi:four helix bundle protein